MEKIKLAKKPIINLSKEIDDNEKEEIIQIQKDKEKLKEKEKLEKEKVNENQNTLEDDDISKLQENYSNDSIDTYITEDNIVKNTVQSGHNTNTQINNGKTIIKENFDLVDEITGKRIDKNRSIPNVNTGVNNIDTQSIRQAQNNINNYNNQQYNQQQNNYNNVQSNNINRNNYNQNLEQQAYNRNKLVNTEEFNRTIDAYYNPNEKAFFNLEDYGYILNTVNEEEQKRIQTEMNELYKRKKNNYYDA